MYTYECVIKKIVDGDTIDVDIDLGFHVLLFNQRIRLFNIDTPECRTTDKVEKVFGLYAKSFVEDVLPIDSKQIIHTELDEKGKFGRILGDFYIFCPKTGENLMLTELMLREHLCVKYNGQSKEDIQKDHIINRKYLIENELLDLESELSKL